MPNCSGSVVSARFPAPKLMHSTAALVPAFYHLSKPLEAVCHDQSDM